MKRRSLEDPEYVAMLRRMIRAAGRRFAESDPDGLALFDSLRKELEDQIALAAARQLDSFSCSQVGRSLGISKQAVHKKFSGVAPGVRSAQSAKAEGAS